MVSLTARVTKHKDVSEIPHGLEGRLHSKEEAVKEVESPDLNWRKHRFSSLLVEDEGSFFLWRKPSVCASACVCVFVVLN